MRIMPTCFIRVVWIVAAALAVITLLAAPARACSVPVFRYALERWAPEIYEVVVFHREPLTDDEQKIVEALKSWGLDGEGMANYGLRVVKVADDMAAEDRKLLDAQKDGPMPRLAVAYPMGQFPEPLAWSAALTPHNARQIMESPLRTKIADSICAGDIAVWVVLESGQKEQDDEVYNKVAAALKPMEDEYKASVAAASTRPASTQPAIEDPFNSDAPQEFAVRFSLVRVSRGDPAEQMFLSTLLNVDKNIRDDKSTLVMPVFGRGRVLGVIPADQVNNDLIESAAQFLMGACSCEIKSQNPGFDVMIASQWAPADGIKPEVVPLPTLAGLAQFAATEAPATRPTAPAALVGLGPMGGSASATSSSLWRNVAILIGAVILIPVLVTIILRARARKGQA